MGAWPPQASYPCGNFSDTSNFGFAIDEGSIGLAFAIRASTGSPNKVDLCPSALRGVSVPTESTFGHLRYSFADVPPQPNSLSSPVLECAVLAHGVACRSVLGA